MFIYREERRVGSGVWNWVRIIHLFFMAGVWFADFPGDDCQENGGTVSEVCAVRWEN